MIRGRPKPTVRSCSHKKINRYYDRKNSSEDKLISLLERAKVPRVFGRGSSSEYRKGGRMRGYMSDEVKIQCGKKLAVGFEDKEKFTQRDIFEAALRELTKE